jgi:2-(1,2-epoxy-1,2-dihydrophenyl)acetyl-CoA isomerase
MARAWADALVAAAGADAVRVVVLAGEGRAFCAGGDLRAFREAPDREAYLREISTEMARGLLEIRDMDKPVIAAVQGAAVGVGLSMVLGCDLRLAAEDARLGMAYINVALTPGGGATWTLPRLVGATRALEMLLLGEPMTAGRALEAGLVTRVVPDGRLREEAQAVAERLARGPRGALARVKHLVWAALDNPLEAQLPREVDSIAEMAASAEFDEGSLAFLEKRPPRFG